jgi:hypothetical protein
VSEAATIEKHWLEYPDGIPVESWGRDHNSTLLYAETRAVDHGGWLSATDPHMRTDRRYPTRLNNGVQVHGHTDYDCLKDAEKAGLLIYDETETPADRVRRRKIGQGRIRFTGAGWSYVHGLRRGRAERALRD